jgi:acetyl esterase
LPGLPIDPRWEPHIPGALRMNDVLRAIGDLVPPMDTPAQVAAIRLVPEAFRSLELAVPVRTRTIAGPAGELRARVAVPETVRAVYLDLHGGGFCLGWPEANDASNARLAQAAGVAVISLDYRLAPEHPFPAGPDDCRAAADWLIDNAAAEFGAATLLIGGDSAGANLAVLTALHLRERGVIERVAGVNLTYGAYDLSGTPSSRNRPADTLVLSSRASNQFHDFYLPGRTSEQLRDPAVSPLFADLSGLPPALLCAGTLDPLLDDTLFMAARWQAAGAGTGVAELQVVPESPHGFAAFPGPMAGELALLHAEWVRARLAGAG